MFSWKNIKTTVRQKVINGETNSEKALGVLETLGKSTVSVGTSIVKAVPLMVGEYYKSQADVMSKNSNENIRNKGADLREKAEKLSNDSKDNFSYYDSDKVSERCRNELNGYKKKLEQITINLQSNDAQSISLEKKIAKLELELQEERDESKKIIIKKQMNESYEMYQKLILAMNKLFQKQRQLERIIDDYELVN